MSASDVPVI